MGKRFGDYAGNDWILIRVVHNGKTFIDVLAVEDMVGHHLGEFGPTRKFIVHGGKMGKDQAKVAQGKAKIIWK